MHRRCCWHHRCSGIRKGSFSESSATMTVNRNRSLIAGVVVVAILAAACDGLPRPTPTIITADGSTWVSCTGRVRISSHIGWLDGDTTYTVSFIDVLQMTHEIRDIKHLEVSQVPSTVASVLPSNPPDPATGRDTDNKPFVAGKTYTWGDGNRATLHHGVWQPAPRPNPVCNPSL